MLYVPNEYHDPAMNLAQETYLLKEKNIDEPIIFFYINRPSVIIGRNQNTLEEVNEDYVNTHHIDVVRRLSGGGAVYHDFGNLNFSFILPDANDYMDFATLTQPIVDAIRHLGVSDVHLSGRNDLLIGEQKFSGNAMYRYNDRMFCHGTLLFDSDLNQINDILTVDPSKLKKKGISSVRSRVTNIKPHLPQNQQKMTTEVFRDAILMDLFDVDTLEKIPTYSFTEEDIEHILEIKASYYDNWDWNYGASPDFNIKNSQRFSSGQVEVYLLVHDGIIKNIAIYGDFFGLFDKNKLVDALTGVAYTEEAVKHALSPFDLSAYLGRDVTQQKLVDLLLSAQSCCMKK